MSNALLLGPLGFAAMFGLIALHVPIGVAMGLVGFAAYGLMAGFGPAASLFGTEAASALSSQSLAVIPLFLLMGNLASRAGMAADLYRLASAFCGQWRGGLMYATVLACAGFGAVSGSSIVTAATMTSVALPEMRRRGYGEALSTGTIAAGGTLGIMVPPSIILVIYAAKTEQFVITLYAATIIPALIAVLLMLIAVALVLRLDPDAAPAGARVDRKELKAAIVQGGAPLALAVAMIGGIAFGVFTVDEAAAVGAAMALATACWRRKLNLQVLQQVLVSTASTTGMFYMMIIGANVLSYFVTASQLPEAVVEGLQAMHIPPIVLLALLLSVFVVLGGIFEEVSVMLLTLPFTVPLIVAMGYTPVWWGIVNLVVIVIGMVAPPIGMNVLVIRNMTPDVPLQIIYRGVMPFVAAQIVLLGLLVASPQLADWLPTALGMK
jgi:C4-dicarboxylate transporter, DctM subunit